MNHTLKWALIALVVCCSPGRQIWANGFTLNVMAPLKVGTASMGWEEFQALIRQAKKHGIMGVSTDVWWGDVEQAPGQFNWDYYDRISRLIVEEGLQWIPILSTHQCGGNVGDTYSSALPEWLWRKFESQGLSKSDLGFRSEHGNLSHESIPPWLTRAYKEEYLRFWRAFIRQYERLAPQIQEINISLGPAGELRYPSYNCHDGSKVSYPSSGALQAYSRTAVENFRGFIRFKYKDDLNALRRAWGFSLNSFDEIYPPTSSTHAHDAGQWFQRKEYTSQYGKDFFEWYHGVLKLHGRDLLEWASSVFRRSPFLKTPLGAKVPGLHWQVSNPDYPRLTELKAGLLPPDGWNNPETGFGYDSILEVFHPILVLAGTGQSSRPILHFTCLEMNCETEPNAHAYSQPRALVGWVFGSANKIGLTVKGENALGFLLHQQDSWLNMASSLWVQPSEGDATPIAPAYEGITFLRLEEFRDPELLKAAFMIRALGVAQNITSGIPPTELSCPDTLFESTKSWVLKSQRKPKSL